MDCKAVCGGYANASFVKKIYVQDSVVYLLCGTIDDKLDTTAIGTRNVPTAWFAIDVSKKMEKGFTSEEEFMAYVKKSNYPQPRWYAIDSLSKAVDDNSKLPWVPK